MYPPRLPILIANFLLCLLLFLIVPRCDAEQPSECVVVDPKDSSTFIWESCGNLELSFTMKEYGVDLLMTPHDQDSKFAYSNVGWGEFCMESVYATSISENVYSEIVFKIETEYPGDAVLELIVYNSFNDVEYQYKLADANEWKIVKDWYMPIGDFKVSCGLKFNP